MKKTPRERGVIDRDFSVAGMGKGSSKIRSSLIKQAKKYPQYEVFLR